MAEDDCAVAEGSASWNLQGGLGIFTFAAAAYNLVRMRNLATKPRSQCVRGPERQTLSPSGDAVKALSGVSLSHKNRGASTAPKSRRPFFHSQGLRWDRDGVRRICGLVA